jgi:hypothetical protein
MTGYPVLIASSDIENFKAVRAVLPQGRAIALSPDVSNTISGIVILNQEKA